MSQTSEGPKPSRARRRTAVPTTKIELVEPVVPAEPLETIAPVDLAAPVEATAPVIDLTLPVADCAAVADARSVDPAPADDTAAVEPPVVAARRPRATRKPRPTPAPAVGGEAEAVAADGSTPDAVADDLEAREAFAVSLRARDRLAEAGAVHAEILASLDRLGTDARRAAALVEAAATALLAGRHESAAALADRAAVVARTGSPERVRAEAIHAHVLVLLGRGVEGRTAATTGLAAAEAAKDRRAAASWRLVLGVADLLAGDADRAVEHLAAAKELTSSRGLAWPEAARPDADLVEALVAAGRPDEARTALAELGTRVASNRLPLGIATLARADAVVRLAAGDAAGALRSLAGAAATIESLPYGLERGRCLLTWGAALRAAGRRNAARAALTTAREAMTRLPSPPWEARVTAETAELRRA